MVLPPSSLCQVFEAEKIVAKAGLIHKYCLACNDCRLAEKPNVPDTNEVELFSSF